MRKTLFLVSLIFCFSFLFSCKLTELERVKKKIVEKIKSKKIVVIYEASYYKTVEGKITKRLIIDFLKKQKKNYKIKKISIKDLDKNLRKENILVVKPTDVSIKGIFHYSSLPLFSDAFYVINSISAEENKIGFLVDNYIQNFVKERFLNFKYHVYEKIENLIIDFRIKRLKTIVIRREDYYKHILFLPYENVYFVNIGFPYSSIFIFDEKMREKFNIYLKALNNNYEWREYLVPYIKDLKSFFKKIDKGFNEFIKGLKEFFTFPEK